MHFLFGVGALHGGTPTVSLTAQCGAAAAPGSGICDPIRGSAAGEEQKLRDEADILRRYPAVSLGVAVRF